MYPQRHNVLRCFGRQTFAGDTPVHRASLPYAGPCGGGHGAVTIAIASKAPPRLISQQRHHGYVREAGMHRHNSLVSNTARKLDISIGRKPLVSTDSLPVPSDR